jgi:hypothetical protein
MTCNLPDIDIDVLDRKHLLSLIPHVNASRKKDDILIEHGPGIHVQRISADFKTNLCSFDYQEAKQRGYWKLDILNNPVPYENLKNKNKRLLLETFDEWELFEYPEIVEQLFHIHEHANLLKEFKPKSIDDLALVLAIIRPWGQKLINSNLTNEEFSNKIWEVEEGYVGFKKSHAFAYAAAIIIQLSTLKEQQ